MKDLIIFFNRRKKEARKPHEIAKKAKSLRGIKAKLHNKQRYKEKVQMRKTYIITILIELINKNTKKKVLKLMKKRKLMLKLMKLKRELCPLIY